MMLRWSIALLAGACIAVLMALMGAATAPFTGLAPLQGPFALFVGAIATVTVARQLSAIPHEPGTSPKTGVDWLVIALFFLFAARSFLWLIFEKNSSIYFLNCNNLGDLSLHLTYIQSFTKDFAFWPDNPILTGTPLRYPLGVDLFNTLLLQAGVPLERGLVWVGLAGAFFTGVTLWRWGRAFVLAGFLCNGGFAAWPFFQTGLLQNYQGPEAWKSIPLALFVTQRTLLYAIPVGLILLWSWKTRLLDAERHPEETSAPPASPPPHRPPPLPFWLELLFYATLPLFHLHTFLFLSLMLGSWVLMGAIGWNSQRDSTANRLLTLGSLQIIALAFIPATLLVYLVSGIGAAENSIHWKPGWMQGYSGQSPALFWLINFGLWPLLILVLFAWLIWQWKHMQDRRAPRRDLLLATPALAIFLLGCFVMFAVWEWDNTKLFLWSYLVLLLPVRNLLRHTSIPVQTAVWCGLFFSGFLSLLAGLGLSENLDNGYALASRPELAQINKDLQRLHLQPKTRIAFAPIYNHPLLLLGYHGIAGYESHMYSHGLDYKATFQNLEHLLKGTSGWEEAAHTLRVRYLFWGTKEEATYGSAPQLWRNHAKPIISSQSGTLYYLQNRAD